MPIIKDPVTGELKVVPDNTAAFTATPAEVVTPETLPEAKSPKVESGQVTRKEYLQKRIIELLAKYDGMESNIPVRGEDSIYWHLQNELRGL